MNELNKIEILIKKLIEITYLTKLIIQRHGKYLKLNVFKEIL